MWIHFKSQKFARGFTAAHKTKRNTKEDRKNEKSIKKYVVIILRNFSNIQIFTLNFDQIIQIYQRIVDDSWNNVHCFKL